MLRSLLLSKPLPFSIDRWWYVFFTIIYPLFLIIIFQFLILIDSTPDTLYYDPFLAFLFDPLIFMCFYPVFLGAIISEVLLAKSFKIYAKKKFIRRGIWAGTLTAWLFFIATIYYMLPALLKSAVGDMQPEVRRVSILFLTIIVVTLGGTLTLSHYKSRWLPILYLLFHPGIAILGLLSLQLFGTPLNIFLEPLEIPAMISFSLIILTPAFATYFATNLLRQLYEV